MILERITEQDLAVQRMMWKNKALLSTMSILRF